MSDCARHDSRTWPGPVTVDSRDRPRVFLGTSARPVDGWRRVLYGRQAIREQWVHPAANAGGWQWCTRFLVWELTGEVLRPDEHAHHVCLSRWCIEPDHLEVSVAEFHGALHAFYTKLRDGRGRFVPEAPQWPPRAVPRFGPIIGNAALGATSF